MLALASAVGLRCFAVALLGGGQLDGWYLPLLILAVLAIALSVIGLVVGG